MVTGHSLGAGTAALAVMLFRETDEKGLTALGTKPETVTCWGYCCPPCVDEKLAQEVTFISCVIHQVCTLSASPSRNALPYCPFTKNVKAMQEMLQRIPCLNGLRNHLKFPSVHLAIEMRSKALDHRQKIVHLFT